MAERDVSQFANQVLEECDSTNDLARALGEAGASQGTWVSARRQGKGRGRLGRRWESLQGNLFLSMLVRLPDKALWTWVPLASAIAVAEVLPQRELRIKWPNDLWIGDAKVGGILCEAVGNRTDSFIVVGLGLNCKASPDVADQKVVALGMSVDLVRVEVVQALQQMFARLSSGEVGSADLRERYAKVALFRPGTSVQWGDASGAGGLQFGAVVGLGEAGELVVTRADGGSSRLFAEDVKIRPN